MQEAISKTYGSDWDKTGTAIYSLRIVVAPKIFTAQEDIELSDGQIVKKGAQYFSWPVAHKLVEENKVPTGFRMLRIKEGEALKEHYNRSGVGLLILGLDGLISPSDMYIYRNSPAVGASYIRHRGERGYYWLDELENPIYPYVISVHGTQIKTSNSIYTSYGLPLLLVKDL